MDVSHNNHEIPLRSHSYRCSCNVALGSHYRGSSLNSCLLRKRTRCTWSSCAVRPFLAVLEGKLHALGRDFAGWLTLDGIKLWLYVLATLNGEGHGAPAFVLILCSVCKVITVPETVWSIENDGLLQAPFHAEGPTLVPRQLVPVSVLVGHAAVPVHHGGWEHFLGGATVDHLATSLDGVAFLGLEGDALNTHLRECERMAGLVPFGRNGETRESFSGGFARHVASPDLDVASPNIHSWGARL